MHRETASEMANLCRRAKTAGKKPQLVQRYDQEVPEIICAQKTQQLACLVIIQDGCSTCPPKQSHNK